MRKPNLNLSPRLIEEFNLPLWVFSPFILFSSFLFNFRSTISFPLLFPSKRRIPTKTFEIRHKMHWIWYNLDCRLVMTNRTFSSFLNEEIHWSTRLFFSSSIFQRKFTVNYQSRWCKSTLQKAYFVQGQSFGVDYLKDMDADLQYSISSHLLDYAPLVVNYLCFSF